MYACIGKKHKSASNYIGGVSFYLTGLLLYNDTIQFVVCYNLNFVFKIIAGVQLVRVPLVKLAISFSNCE